MEKITHYIIKEIETGKIYDDWVFKNSFTIDEYATRAKDKKRTFLNRLRKLGIKFEVKIHVQQFVWGFEITDFKTGEPLYIALNTVFDFIKREELNP